ncbi:MAG: hypothetical protein J0M26_02180 [Planctomycetes bacterium]|nr:hypothetical protein [Planctomycetota bacterium]
MTEQNVEPKRWSERVLIADLVGRRSVIGDVALIMSQMQCKCGHIISDAVCPCVTEADVIGDAAYERFDRDFTRDVTDFLASVHEGRRNDWLVENFGAIYPNDLPDAEIISDLLTANFRNMQFLWPNAKNVDASGFSDALVKIITVHSRLMKVDTSRISRSLVRPIAIPAAHNATNNRMLQSCRMVRFASGKITPATW